MRPRYFATFFWMIVYLARYGAPAIAAGEGTPIQGQQRFLGDQNFVTLTPDFSKATMNDSTIKIPFTVKNNYSEDIVTPSAGNALDGLMTLDKSGNKVFLEVFRFGPLGSIRAMSGWPNRIVLKPGESGTAYGYSTIETLSCVPNQNVFGVITGSIVRTHQLFRSYSDPFIVPSSLTTIPWVDLGEQSFFSVTVDLTNSLFYGGNIPEMTIPGKPNYAEKIKGRWADGLGVSVKVKNTTNQGYIAVAESIRFYIVRDGLGRNVPSPWESIKASGPTVKQSESAEYAGNITLKELESQGYNQGSKLVAAVGGRIPNTNQIFECYSAPFELPPLPLSHPPKK